MIPNGLSKQNKCPKDQRERIKEKLAGMKFDVEIPCVISRSSQGRKMRTNLNVPYEEKDQAGRLGAKWDRARKTWYVEDMERLEPFLKWISESLKKPTTKSSTHLKKHKNKH